MNIKMSPLYSCVVHSVCSNRMPLAELMLSSLDQLHFLYAYCDAIAVADDC